MGAERKTSFISEEVKKMTAYHEVCLPSSTSLVHKVLITVLSGWSCSCSALHRRRHAAAQGYLRSSRPCSRHCMSKAEICILRNRLTVFVALFRPVNCPRMTGIRYRSRNIWQKSMFAWGAEWPKGSVRLSRVVLLSSLSF